LVTSARCKRRKKRKEREEERRAFRPISTRCRLPAVTRSKRKKGEGKTSASTTHRSQQIEKEGEKRKKEKGSCHPRQSANDSAVSQDARPENTPEEEKGGKKGRRAEYGCGFAISVGSTEERRRKKKKMKKTSLRFPRSLKKDPSFRVGLKKE